MPKVQVQPPANAAKGKSGTARYIVRLDGSLAWAGLDFALSPGDPARFADWHDYVRTTAEPDALRYLRVVSERGDPSHQPMGTFHALPADFSPHVYPVYRRRGSLDCDKWSYVVDGLKAKPQVNVPAVGAPVETSVPAQPKLNRTTGTAGELVPVLNKNALAPASDIAPLPLTESATLPENTSQVLTEDASTIQSGTVPNHGFTFPEEVSPSGLLEGAVRTITVNAYERNDDARDQCIATHGTRCCICNFSFGETYGPQAEGYIHVHHLRPLSEIRAEHDVDPINDLRPVCPNCHAVLHLGARCRTIEEVQHLLRRPSAS